MLAASMPRARTRRRVVLAHCPSRFGRGPTRLDLAPRCARPARTSSGGPCREERDTRRSPRSGPAGPPPRERRLDAVMREDPPFLVVELHEPPHRRPPHAVAILLSAGIISRLPSQPGGAAGGWRAGTRSVSLK